MVPLLLDARDPKDAAPSNDTALTIDPRLHGPLPAAEAAPSLQSPPSRIATAVAAVGDWLMRNQHWVKGAQWFIVALYIFLVAAPVFLPHPLNQEHIWTNLTLFAQFLFWGIWWPFVLLSMVFFGRLWCGVLCPEGSLSERAAQHSLGRAVPRWMKWHGWPFLAFACTTAYGQFLSVYQYPKPALLILGGSTLAAIAVAFVYGRDKRVWCRYLCPVHGVFALLSKLSPFHYRVDQEAWRASPKPTEGINCAPMAPIRTMLGASDCHMCGRCSGFRGAVTLSLRAPGSEIVHVAGRKPRPWETRLIIFGLLGLVTGAFHWANSDLFMKAKQVSAEWLIDRDITWPITAQAPWWILTSYPDQNDVMSPLDGALLFVYLLAATVLIGGSIALVVAFASRALTAGRPPQVRRNAYHHLAQSLIPVAAGTVFFGLFGTTLSMLRAETIIIPHIATVRMLVMAGACLWTFALAWRITRSYSTKRSARLAGTALTGAGALVGFAAWASTL